MLSPRRTRRRQIAIAMTPMIDVVFLLLIYFVCTASFTPPESVLPSALAIETQPGGASEPREQTVEGIVVRVELVSGRPRWQVNQREAATADALSEILDALAAVDTGLAVVLDVAGHVPLGDAVDTYDRCRRAGFHTLQFAVRDEVQ